MAERTPSTKPRSRSVIDSDLSGPPSRSAGVSTTYALSSSSTDIRHSRLDRHSLTASAPSSPTKTKTVASAPVISLSSRVTRASARQAASQTNSQTAHTTSEKVTDNSTSGLAISHTTKKLHRKRKARDEVDINWRPRSQTGRPVLASHHPKRTKTVDPKTYNPSTAPGTPHVTHTRSENASSSANMASPSLKPGDALEDTGSSSRRSSRGKKVSEDLANEESIASDSSNRAKHSPQAVEEYDTLMTGVDESESGRLYSPSADSEGEHGDSDDHDEDDLSSYAQDSISDPFGGGFSLPPRGAGFPVTLSMLGGMLSMSGMGGRLRDILHSLRQKDDPSVQLIALQELSEILLVSNEDNLSGSFSPDAYVRELVTLMQPNETTGEENPEVMLLACRCLANLMEALPASVANVVYGGAVSVLCQKLLEISFIDLAEQALSTLEKISVEYPASIVREGGLTACLSYLEFFATSTQRTAVTTAANCCRNIPEDSFPVVRDVMPILLNVLNSSDQRVVEQAALCVSRIVESFKHQPPKLEELVGVDMLLAILRLLLPGSTNYVMSPNLRTQFLRVLAITAHDSPRLAAELFKMNVVETLYQILTGVTPPSDSENISSKLDSVLIMQALIHRPREQIIETLNVICNLLPRETTTFSGGPVGDRMDSAEHGGSRKRSTSNEKRVDLLSECKGEVRRFSLILLPTLTDAYSSTVNLDVRSKVLLAQLRMLSNFDRGIILEALKAVPYASFLASILSQQDHPLLVNSALQATELLLVRLGDVYKYQLYREGVISEIEKIAAMTDTESELERETQPDSGNDSPGKRARSMDAKSTSDNEHTDHDDGGEDTRYVGDRAVNASLGLGEGHGQNDEDRSQHSSEDDEVDEGEDDETNDDHIDDHIDETPGSPANSEESATSTESPPRRFTINAPSRNRIALFAKRILNTHETEKNGTVMRKNATKILSSLFGLAQELSAFYLDQTLASLSMESGTALFQRLAAFFDADVFDSITSAELLESGIVHVLEHIFSNSDDELANAARSSFIEVFMGQTVKSQPKTVTRDSPTTPFSVLLHKLQDLLSRSEHFEVITVHQNTFDGNHTSAASMLAKQIRLRLVADDDSDIPGPFRSIMVSIHAIATFQTLEDYLRPRISHYGRPRNVRNEGLSRALAAVAESGRGAFNTAATRLAERNSRLLQGGPLMSRHTSVAPGPDTSEKTPSRHTSQSQLTPAVHQGGTQSSRKISRQKSVISSSPVLKAREDHTLPDQASGLRDKASQHRSPRYRPAKLLDDPSQHLEGANSSVDAHGYGDETHSSDADENDFAGEDILDALVGSIDEDKSAQSTDVNLDVTSDDKSATIRREDETRIIPSSRNSPSVSGKKRASALTAALQGSVATPSPSLPSRVMPYSAPVQQNSQPWHMEFILNGKSVPMESTVYRAVLLSASTRDEHPGRSIWSTIHSVHYRRVPGSKRSETSLPGYMAGPEVPDNNAGHNPLNKNPTTSSILRLLRILHDLNANIEGLLVANKEAMILNVEPLSQFVNTKLTAKLNRQLEEPLIVASSCLPNWSEDLAGLYPFLFPFETRHLFLQSTSFGYARSMTRWQNSQGQEESRRDRRDDRPYLGRLQRQKVRISRAKILESAVKVMELYGASQSMLEVEYFEEVGTGLGPTLEFYSTVSREFCRKKLKLWRDNDLTDSEFVICSNGLFPRPLGNENTADANGERALGLFRALGKFVARSMLDSRIIDINFNPIFFRIGGETTDLRPSLGAIKLVDPGLARSLQLIKKFEIAKNEIDDDLSRSMSQKLAAIQAIAVNGTHIDDLSLDFTLPGYPEIELIADGADVNVTIENVGLYVERVVSLTLGDGVRRQVDAFREGFSEVFPYSTLSTFTPDELSSLFGQVEEDWSIETLTDSVKADHGFNMDSRSVKNLLQVMSELTLSERRDFLQFTTGSPKLPIGGFRSLTPTFTVVCKPSESPFVSDDYLPSVMTCVNYLKLPDYTTVDVLRKRLFVAIKEGQGAFHLS